MKTCGAYAGCDLPLKATMDTSAFLPSELSKKEYTRQNSVTHKKKRLHSSPERINAIYKKRVTAVQSII